MLPFRCSCPHATIPKLPSQCYRFGVTISMLPSKHKKLCYIHLLFLSEAGRKKLINGEKKFKMIGRKKSEPFPAHHNATICKLPCKCSRPHCPIHTLSFPCSCPHATIPMLLSQHSHPNAPLSTLFIMLPSPCSLPQATLCMLPSACYHFNVTVSILPSQYTKPYHSHLLFPVKLEKKN